MPILAFAYPQGILGEFAWAEEHVRDAESLGQVFPEWYGPWGSQKHFAKAVGFKRTVAAPGSHMRPLIAILGQEPLCASEEAVKAAGVREHTAHGTPSDLAATIEQWPSYPFALEERDRCGFSRSQVNELGHWLRLRGALHDERPADDYVRAAATGEGRAQGTRNQRADQVGRYQRGDGRAGSRSAQIKLRARLIRVMRAAVAHYAPGSWMDLPAGAESIGILRSF